jgi:hypothetical protein
LSSAYQEIKAKDAEKQAILDAEKAAIQAKEAERNAWGIEAAATRERVLLAKIKVGDACTRCFRSDRKDASKTHRDDDCRASFCEECYAHAIQYNTGSRNFTTHETIDCIYVQRRLERKLEEQQRQAQRKAQQEVTKRQQILQRELESDFDMLRRQKNEKAKKMRQQKAGKLYVAEELEESSEASTAPTATIRTAAHISPQEAAATPAEAKAIWQKKSSAMIAEAIKKAEEEKALPEQREAEEAAALKAVEDARIAKEMEEKAAAKKLIEDKIAEKKARLEAFCAKIRDAKAKAEEKKISNSQKKKRLAEAAQHEKSAKKLTIEIVVDERLFRETLRQMNL